MSLAAVLLAAVISHAEPNVVLEPVVPGLSVPVAIAHAGDSRLFIVQQSGRIRIYDPPQLLAQPFLDVSSIISSGGERGLLGLAFHPRYAENGFFYVNYTDTAGDTKVVRYTRSAADPNRADAASARLILDVDQPFSNHNGGQLQFGPDGYLYIGLGDGGSGGDPGNRAQNLSVLLGKMLRIDVDGAEPYAIPPSNPFVGRPGARAEIWASGLRNPWRYSFDRNFGDLWIADVGQGQWEEISFQPRTSIGGENYGWRRMEGTHCFEPSTNCNDGTLVQPVIEYNHSAGACSVTGGYVYRGTRSRRLNDMYIYADFCNGRIMGARRDASGRFVSKLLFDAPFQVSTFGEDVNGELYVASYGTGEIFRIVDTVPMPKKRRSVGR
ncbi:MAG TPA: PQQ-dependent sugar dehydrogenase [Thermoanaerobaculia bacterium]|nr:PQQ-dependent sugar dehydrogenase [Thermoanaerobaculia bacterium]